MKKCNQCKKELNLNNFAKDQYRKDGLNGYCKKCTRKRSSKYRIDHPEKSKLNCKKYYQKNKDILHKKAREYYLKPNINKRIKIQHKIYYASLSGRDVRSNRFYDVSVSDMLKWQDYKCAICQEKEGVRQLGVDHNHNTEQVGMLLCNECNIGRSCRDNIIITAAYLEYLKTYHC